ncbi:eukaryotic aspartyl protease family protein [Striga asiatica]|uniref:Eukaryotic aspartyl protease family protein n=1 Tax=Striga asiatica TaxID=4170 RepID=A0A5A7QTT3_STRAF|nr:eukaryotic aspartyl protease family protein [Striga asiatica]
MIDESLKTRRADPCAKYRKAAACFPVRYSIPLKGDDEYVFAVTVGLGTPPTTNSLILDSTTDIMDKLSLHPIANSKLPADKDILFGCSQASWGEVVGAEAGFMGLGTGNLSIVSQTAANSYFSYCLPSNTFSQGFLALGNKGSFDKYNNTKFTPLLSTSPNDYRYSSSYFIDTISIAVDGCKLEISPAVLSGGTLIDTISTIGVLHPQAYAPLSREFKKQVINNHGFTSAPPYTTEDNHTLHTCFFTPNNTTKPTTVPIVTFTFKDNVKVDLDASGTLFVVNKSIVCLAFLESKYYSFPVVFANTQQKTYEVVFDVAGGRVGFLPNRCP